MRLSFTQLRIIEFISQETNVSVKDISSHIHISPSMAYKHVKELTAAGFLDKIGAKRRQKYSISSNAFARILCSLFSEDSAIKKTLANEGIPLLARLAEERKTLKELAKEAGLSLSSAYPYIKRFTDRQILRKINGSLEFNEELWPQLHQFIALYLNYYALSRFKVPANAKIHFESADEIVYSLKDETAFGEKTAFSAYGRYGIELMENEVFYRQDNLHKRPDIQTIFADSLKAARGSPRRRLYCYLFYRKNIKSLGKVKHPDLDILKKIASGIM